MAIVYEMVNGSEVTNINTSHNGGFVQIQAKGSFSGATLRLELDQDGQGFLILDDYVKTSPNSLLFNVKGGMFKFSVINQSGSTSITVSVI